VIFLQNKKKRNSCLSLPFCLCYKLAQMDLVKLMPRLKADIRRLRLLLRLIVRVRLRHLGLPRMNETDSRTDDVDMNAAD
jgi:hypothetical protein